VVRLLPGRPKNLRISYLSDMRILYILLSALLCSASFALSAQKNEYFKNPSFKDTPRMGGAPKWWIGCSFKGESPVDVHSNKTEFFGVKEIAADGKTFLGMVTRDNGTYEGVTTKLKQPLQADSSYKLTIFINRAKTYSSISRANDQPVNYDSPTRLEIWAGSDYCKMITLLEEYDSENVDTWTEVTFYFTPDQTYNYLGLYVRHLDEFEDTNGNILLDNITLVRVSEDEIGE